MQKNYDAIQNEDAELIAISVDTIADTKRTVQNEGLTFPVLSDDDLEAITAYNVVNQVNLVVARPATYIIESDGTITWKSLDTLVRRVPTAAILQELRKLW